MERRLVLRDMFRSDGGTNGEWLHSLEMEGAARHGMQTADSLRLFFPTGDL